MEKHMEFTHLKGDKYHVTGILTTGKRFSPIITDNPHYALSINLYRGSVWQVRDGKRKLIKRVFN
jgi:hypothetical protein